MRSTDPVTELVRIPLAVPFDKFLSTFTSELEPVLLAQDGITSILTGEIVTPGSPDGDFAVSLTQWENMDAHAAFLASRAAKPFFETLKPLATGPPTIEHYCLGAFPLTALRSRFVHVTIHDPRDGTVQHRVLENPSEAHDGRRFEGGCLEVQGQVVELLFSDDGFAGRDTVGQAASFVVRIERSTKRTSSRRPLSNL